MKGKWVVATLLLLVLALGGAVFATSRVNLVVDGQQIKPEVPILLIDGHLILPLRQVAAAMGATVQWDENSKVLNVLSPQPAPVTGGPTEIRYDPRVPGRLTSPEMALQAYFDALSNASNLTGDQGETTGGTAGMGTEPYPTAYGYWTKEWQAQHPYKEFLASWQGTAHLDLLKLLPAGQENSRPRFFVEVKTWEAAGQKPHLGIFYHTGFFTVAQTPEGWRNTGGRLDPEVFDFGGHEPWRSDPEAVARIAVGHSIAASLGRAVRTSNADGTVKESFLAPDGKVSHWAVLVQTENSRWQVIDQG